MQFPFSYTFSYSSYEIKSTKYTFTAFNVHSYSSCGWIWALEIYWIPVRGRIWNSDRIKQHWELTPCGSRSMYCKKLLKLLSNCPSQWRKGAKRSLSATKQKSTSEQQYFPSSKTETQIAGFSSCLLYTIWISSTNQTHSCNIRHPPQYRVYTTNSQHKYTLTWTTKIKYLQCRTDSIPTTYTFTTL